MKSIRWVATSGYTLYDEKGREYIFDLVDSDDTLTKEHSYRETMEGIEFYDLDGELVIKSWYDLELGFD
jgi:hypothetical protein